MTYYKRDSPRMPLNNAPTKISYEIVSVNYGVVALVDDSVLADKIVELLNEDEKYIPGR